jgi:predicted SAM-dependent methyltransferase
MDFSIARKMRRAAGLLVKRRLCPICGWTGFNFDPFGNAATFRRNALCPICGSLERHRLAYLLLRDRLKRSNKVLHVAPEHLVIPWLVSLCSDYLNIDLVNPAMRQMDLTALDLPDLSKTLIWCSHVLEHIPHDRAALYEMYRVLEPGGLLVLQVPIAGEVTQEDPTVQTGRDRLTKFLQEDHVRLYGLDLKERIEEAGFECEVLTSNHLSPEDRERYAVDARFYREVFLCRRPATPLRSQKPNALVAAVTQDT